MFSGIFLFFRFVVQHIKSQPLLDYGQNSRVTVTGVTAKNEVCTQILKKYKVVTILFLLWNVFLIFALKKQVSWKQRENSGS